MKEENTQDRIEEKPHERFKGNSNNLISTVIDTILVHAKSYIVTLLILGVIALGSYIFLHKSKVNLEILPPENKQVGAWEIDVKNAEVIHKLKKYGTTYEVEDGGSIVNIEIEATSLVDGHISFFDVKKDQIQVYIEYLETDDLVGLSYVSDFKIKDISGQHLFPGAESRVLASNFYPILEKDELKALKSGKAIMHLFFIEDPDDENSDYVIYTFAVK